MGDAFVSPPVCKRGVRERRTPQTVRKSQPSDIIKPCSPPACKRGVRERRPTRTGIRMRAAPNQNRSCPQEAYVVEKK